jgi:UDP-N-acetylmuramoyl-L-alanyl-D-glutamate--2,6-diaminopimelate ligase
VVVGEEAPIIEASDLLRVVPEVLDIDGMTLQVTSPWGSGACRVPLVGVHNAFNCAAVLATACAMGIEFNLALKGLEMAKAPRGRLEPVHTPEDTVRVFVDYAHTDDAITNVLHALKAVLPPRGSLTVVFGAGGDRDRSKRPRMAEAACRGADLVMVTSDNPRTEDPEEIVQEILAGVPESDRSRVSAEVDRAAAIDRAIQSAKPGDVVVIAGKGHEDYQIIGTTKRHFDDVESARSALMRRREGAPA